MKKENPAPFLMQGMSSDVIIEISTLYTPVKIRSHSNG